MRNKTNQILLAVIIVLVGVLAAVLVWQKSATTPTYHAVYLDTGDLYFGKLITFPKLGLTNVHVLQLGQGETPVSIQKFVDVVWGPVDYIAINRDKVVWMAPLDSAKQLATFINTGLVNTGQPLTGGDVIESTTTELTP